MALRIDSVSASSLAPGFRFHPTDEELVRYYLRRKVCGQPFRLDAISDVDVYKVEPWDLPALSRLKTRDLEWYFFSVLDKKYGNGSRTNRATEKGYWKTTGKDRTVYFRSELTGMKKTLVYHSGRAPKGERTNWVMHEYRLIDKELESAGVVQDAFVLCRIFHKSGSGPKNGEKYGAPLIEEEWDEEESIFVPKQEDFTEEFPVDMDSFLDANELAQIMHTDMPGQDGPRPLSFYQADNINYADVSTAVTNDPQNSLVSVGEYSPQVDESDGSKSFGLPLQTVLDPVSVDHGYIGEPSNPTNFDLDSFINESFFDAAGEFSHDDSLYFQADDFNTDSGLDMLNEYFNKNIDNFQYSLDSTGDKNIFPDSFLNLENVTDGTNQVSDASQQFEGQNDYIAPYSKQEHPAQEAGRKRGYQSQETDIAHPFLKKASYMLGNIAAPPAFASEFPTKYMAAASQPSSSGMIQFGNVSFNGGAVDLSLGKHTQVNIVLSFGLGQREVNSFNSHQAGKVNSSASRGWFYCAFIWILMLSLSFKIGSLVCPRAFMS
ncbi:NAC domain containing protein 2 [Artemisia annua]|uniref:NAC domain containing protein 2 n=1 Tax=Artemisia annua TaxID=35608 RepID=A0A2U1MGJ9_ARTAN|nr:NAC domain containing protein 2 [Artemisia annua]